MAPFSSRFITSARRTWAFSLCTVVASTPWKRDGLRANWSVSPRFTVVITHVDTPGRKAVIQFIVTHTERDHVAHSHGGTLIMQGEEDRWMLSLRWWWGMRALSQRELPFLQLIKSSAPLLFPHRSLGPELLSGKKAICERREARLKLSQWGQSCWAQRQCGISPSMTHTQRECHPHAGGTCTSYNDGAAFATTPWNLLFCEALWIYAGWLQGMTESASWSLGEVLMLEAFKWRRAKILQWRVSKEGKRRNLRCGGRQRII